MNKTIKLKKVEEATVNAFGGIEITVNPEQEADLLAQLTKKQGRWKPEMGEYYYIDLDKDVMETYVSDCELDDFLYSIGNVYQTRAEAEQALKTGWVARLQAEQRIKDYILEKGYDTDVDWSDGNQNKKHCIIYNLGIMNLDISYDHTLKYSTLPYFVHEHEAEDTLNACKEDYKLLLGVE